MKSSILLCIILTVCFRLVFSLDCPNAPGISFIPCQNPSASLTGGSGGTGAASSPDNTIVVEPCTDIQYNGGKPQKYTVTNQEVPQVFELLFETINIPDGDKLLIKTFKCDPNNECKIGVIDSTAANPFSVYINKYSFILASPSSSVSATFKLNLDCTPDCNDFTQEGDKKLKKQPNVLSFQDCFDACETSVSRMLKITSVAESNNIPPAYIPSWLGVQQTGPINYKWNDNTTFTVTLANGKIPEYESMNPWYTLYPSAWDKTTHDSRNCLVFYSGGWLDDHCQMHRPCVCECTLQ